MMFIGSGSSYNKSHYDITNQKMRRWIEWRLERSTDRQTQIKNPDRQVCSYFMVVFIVDINSYLR